jgi:hypothetical protein
MKARSTGRRTRHVKHVEAAVHGGRLLMSWTSKTSALLHRYQGSLENAVPADRRLADTVRAAWFCFARVAGTQHLGISFSWRIAKTS